MASGLIPRCPRASIPCCASTKGINAAHARTYDAADVVPVVRGDLKAAVVDSLSARLQSKLRHAIHAPGLFAAEELVGVKILDLARQLILRKRSVVARYKADAIDAGGGVRPSLVYATARRADDAHPGNNDPLFIQALLHCGIRRAYEALHPL